MPNLLVVPFEKRPFTTMMTASTSPRSFSPKSALETSRRRPQAWIIFVIGFCCGHFHAALSSSKHVSLWGDRCDVLVTDRSCYSQQTQVPSSSSSAVSQTSTSMRKSTEGWNSIQVFVGAASSSAIEQAQKRWFSQARQDELVIGLLKHKTDGYFIDLAANDATTLSNTFALEHTYNWTGLCIEANPEYWYNLSTVRTGSHVVGAVVGNRTGDLVHFRFDNGDHGGIVGFDNGPRWRSHAQKRTTVTLLDIVTKFQSPAVMDYLSLDVEGAEHFVLGNFPLDRYSFRIITAERLRGEIRHYLKLHGFRFVEKLTRWGESLWINEAYEDELDLSVVDQFGFPLF